MRVSHWIIGAVVFATAALAPSIASAVVRINVERVDLVPNGSDQTVFVDVFLTDLDGSNEELAAFTTAIDGIGFTPTGVRFLPPPGLPSSAHPYVFQGDAGGEPEDFGSTYNRFQVGAGISGPQGVDVNGLRSGLFRIPIHIPANEFPWGKGLVIDPTVTDFAGTGAPIVVQIGPPAFWLPEPGAAGLACAAAAMLLRRRKRA